MRRRAITLALLGLCAAAPPAQAVQPGRNGLLATPFADNEESGSATGARPGPIRYGYLGFAGGTTPVRPFAWCEFSRGPAPCQKFRTVEFSPDGTQIADAGWIGGLVVRRLDGSFVRQVTTLTTSSPTWSPDGTRLAFLSAGDLFTIHADGTGLRRITRTQGGSTAGSPGSVSWSSRGRLAVTFLQQERTTLATMGPDGRGARVVRRLHGRSLSVDWTPDGRGLLVSGGRVVLIRARGRARTRVLRHDGDGARMSPDGKRIAFYPTRGTVDNIAAIARADGRAAREVTLVDGETGYPDEGYFELWRETGPLSWQPLP